MDEAMTETVGSPVPVPGPGVAVSGPGPDPEIDWDDEPGTALAPEPGGALPEDSWSLGEARDWLRERVDRGASCPCCHQFAKVYRRKINAAMARALILMWDEGGRERRLYVHVPSIDPTRGGDVAKMQFWGLIEEERGSRADGGRAGFWRVTQRGEDWLGRRITVPKYIRVYDGKPLNTTGVAVSIDDALGDEFRLDDLMAGI
jgi:hypothetical protein